MGALCGYVGVYPGNPLHGRPYDEADLDAHGGVNFAEGCAHTDDESRFICHIPEPGTSDNVWWFSFDCGHLFDLVPCMPRGIYTEVRELGFMDVYRDVDYVAAEVTHLAHQLAV